ncbi:metallophosphoesterase family protein [Bacillus suaedae]|uniref:Metallophosphoesterase family protein n=1 Tax=Halalkalibacter suaedae TaxID=2822140 RepID=A0A940WWS3_9BACI|nr:metallophosphoesterase family protein [Bacillus suaedae]MBP3949551.1 metallophosphoesterase family protein [Bacillus suaedae]
MNKIAVISDIHGNIPALEAVLYDINELGIDEIICLGDLVGKGPDSSKVVDIIKQSCQSVIMGNWDDFITSPSEYKTIQWHQAQLSDKQNEYLRSLPFSTEFWMSGKFIRLFHASPRSAYERVQPWDSYDKRVSLFENSDQTENIEGTRRPDIVGYGDIHNAFIQHLEGKTLFNVGSVGNPLDLTQASYVILEGEYLSKQEETFSIQFRRVPYNIKLAIERAKEAMMPELEDYIQELTTAKYRGLKNN